MTECPSCNSTDPKVCRWVWVTAAEHPHGQYEGCCKDPFHVVPPDPPTT